MSVPSTLPQAVQRITTVIQKNGVGGITPDVVSLLLQDLITAVWAYAGASGLTSPAAAQILTVLSSQGTRQTAMASSVPAVVVAFRTIGYAQPNDGGGAAYARLSAAPVTPQPWQFQTVDGAWWDLCEPAPNVLQLGAKGDGVTNDTQAWANADAFARLRGLEMYFPSGTYMVSQCVINIGSRWRGDGKDGTIVRSIIGSNKDVFYGVNSAANYGLQGNAATGFPYNFEIHDFDLDGNWNGGAGNTSGGGVAFYGDHFNMSGIFVRNVAGTGIRTEFGGDSAVDYDTRYLESSIDHVRVDYIGGHGCVFNGPHDAVHQDIIIVDAGQQAANTYDGFQYLPNTSSRNIAIHASTRSGRLRMRHSVNITAGAGNSEFSGGCQIEGAGVAPLNLAGVNCYFDSTTRIYATYGNATVLMQGACQRNRLHGMLDTGGGNASPLGIYIGATSGDNVTDNDVDLFMNGQNNGAVAFTAGDKGRNIFRVKMITTANVSFTGVPHAQSRMIFEGLVNGVSPLFVDTWRQNKYVTLPANGSYVWTFPFPFRSNPVPGVTITVPTVAPTGQPWISAISATALTVFNPNSNPMPAFLSAENEA